MEITEEEATRRQALYEQNLWRDLLTALTAKEMAELARRFQTVDQDLEMRGPKTDDELWDRIREVFQIEVPRVSVCPDHCAPFDFIADVYFQRTQSALAIAGRGCSKTLSVAIIHYLRAEHYPGYWGMTVGATLEQGKTAYEHLRKIVTKDGSEKPGIKSCIQSLTEWNNGSKVQIAPSTTSSVNGPHPILAHIDELELVDDEVYKESRSMAAGAESLDGRYMIAQNIATSTMKWAGGRVAQLKTDAEEAQRLGHLNPRDLYQWCLVEATEQVKNCRSAPENKDKPEEELCQCNRVVRGEWSKDNPRTLESVCKGRFYKSRGWKPYEDIITLFVENDRYTWEAQIECLRPSSEDNYLPMFSRNYQGVRDYYPNPNYGSIYMGVDFGGSAPHAVGWWQVLDLDLEVKSFTGDESITMPKGSHVCFDEVYLAGVGNMRIAQEIHAHEAQWKTMWAFWKVNERYPDPAAAGAILDFNQPPPSAGIEPIKLVYRATRDFDEHVKYFRELFEDELFYVDVERCPMFCMEMEVWRQRNGVEVKKHNHMCAQARYTIANIRQMMREGGESIKGNAPSAADDGYSTRQKAVVEGAGKTSSLPDAAKDSHLGPMGSRMARSERWRQSLLP